MSNHAVVAGHKQHKTYKDVRLDGIVGKTVEAVVVTTVDGENGKEPCVQLCFTDGTRHIFVLPTDV